MCDVAKESQSSFRYHAGMRSAPSLTLYDECKGSSGSGGDCIIYRRNSMLTIFSSKIASISVMLRWHT